MHHISVSLKRAGKKGKTFTLQAMIKKARFFRKQLETVPVEDDMAAKRGEWDVQLKKLDEDLGLIKTLSPTNLLHQRFLSALRKSKLPGIERLLQFWDCGVFSGTHMPEETAESEVAGVGLKSTDAVPVLTRLEDRIAATAPIRDTVKDAIEDLFVIITGRGSDGTKRTKAAKSLKTATAASKATSILTKTTAGATPTSKRKRSEDTSKAVSSTFVTSLGGEDNDSQDEYSRGEDDSDDDNDQHSLPPMYDYGSDEFSSGDSESEEERPVKKVKKNRPGQQARRAQAERKFGKTAQHILSNKLSVAAHAEQQKLRKRQAAMLARSTYAAPPQPNQPAHLQPKHLQQPKPKAGSGAPLHPSWEAKRKAKEAMAQVASSAKPKKIVFGDDDD
ncbi:BUD22-domain-containing protein [Powellomyces hirtus]|nr:BUD22-domain-containing protein [Powellomyces hirtus]